ncbi:GIY-YIG nuclease family protein [Cuneatibacter caecimuris]|uniref:GIY-YIG catalytic domain-containing protein n=1 Tax=Cuneatibacter caecimuris TaxID=1796618 RepID=A0A4Q7PKE8_9FIRM|nr:GIY-YIG nuclease family protein [Cuneatibacter caecimuris]RZT01193.1 GIY-YIG catalytic domain-containing protein [Cuneatibacter caecimuris]
MEEFVGIYIIIIILSISFLVIRNINIKKKIKSLADNTLEITPKEFFKIRNSSNGGKGRKHISTQYDFAGVYIIYNHTKNMYYVGQGKKVFQRVNRHFTGNGNGNVYADYKYGDFFTIKMIALEQSGFISLNELERNTIKTYNAYSKGYNKTKGNRG